METFSSLFTISSLLLGALLFIAMLAGFIDSIVGGGGLLVIPALMAAGVFSTNALTTNKLQARDDSISATIYFTRCEVASLSDQKLSIAVTSVGSTGGVLLVQYVQADVLWQILPILVVCIGLYFLLMPKLGEEDRQRRMYGLPLALIAGGCIGFYNGSFGLVAGLLYALAFIMLCGFNFARAMAHAKLLNVMSNIGGLLLLILGSRVIRATGFVMLVGQLLGAHMGLRLMLSKGQKLIRLMIVIVLTVTSVKLLYDSHRQETPHRLGMD